jgi:hypothetical protein
MVQFAGENTQHMLGLTGTIYRDLEENWDSKPVSNTKFQEPWIMQSGGMCAGRRIQVKSLSHEAETQGAEKGSSVASTPFRS